MPIKYVSVFVVYQTDSRVPAYKGIKTKEYLIPTSMKSLLNIVEEEISPVLRAEDYPEFEDLMNEMEMDETILKNHDTGKGGTYHIDVFVERDNTFVVQI
jgi:hypothetical protein